MTEPQTLLADYVKGGSETAFRELVSRYIDLVFSTALRQVFGDRQLAEDVAQTVFLNLARKAHRLPKNVMLGGWLHQDTCNVAGTLMRSERRRHARERQAVEMQNLSSRQETAFAGLGPTLDAAINQLNAEDRAAILLRFFEQRDFRSVGEALGTSEDAARMRVNRSLEKLHSLLSSQGVTLSVAAVAAGLATEAVTAAPAGLAAGVAAGVLPALTGTGSIALGLGKAGNLGKFKLGVVGIAAAATLAVPLFLGHRYRLSLLQENELLRENLRQAAASKQENERLSNLLAEATSKPRLTNEELGELLRLRGEVGRLRQANRELEQARQAQPASDLLPGVEPPQFILIAGEVQIPNRYLWTNGMTLATAIELAHGFTPYADQGVFRLKPDTLPESFHNMTEQSRQTFQLNPGDRVFVPRLGDAPRTSTPLQLYTRVFRLDDNLIAKMEEGVEADPSGKEGARQSAHDFLQSNGVYLSPPKTAFIDATNKTLLVRASVEDLDKVETLLVQTRRGTATKEGGSGPEQQQDKN